MKSKLPHNFGALPPKYSNYKNANIVILPVPFDKTSSWIKGSDKGPGAIINASRHLELYDIETDSEVYMKGIHTAKGIISGNSPNMVKDVRGRVDNLLDDNKFTVLLGGEHMVSLGAIEAHAGHFSDMSILHLDAHSDMRDSYYGDRFSHACIMARAKETTGNIVSIGIRSSDTSELGNMDKSRVFHASAINKSKDWIRKATGKLSQNVYISIDLDVFDPSIMPSTGTPEPGGLDWYQVIDLLEYVSQRKNIVGFDVVELCPSKYNMAPDFLAAKLIYKLLSFKFA